jgi:cell division protein FtsW
MARSRALAPPPSAIALPSLPLTIFCITLALVTLGIVVVYSSSTRETYLLRQSAFAGLGLTAMMFFYHFDYNRLRRYGTGCMLAAMAALVLVLLIGPKINGARRWLMIGGFGIQPSEFAKLALAIYMAKMLADRQPYTRSFFSGVMPACLLTCLFMGLIVVEPDLGATLVLGAIIFGMWVAAEMKWFHLLGLIAASLPPIIFAFIWEPYRWKRLMAFLFMDEHSIRGTGLQLYQSLVAVGSGGVWGRGLGESVQKFYYLPERHTDFIFAIMGEELGFLRLGLIVAGFAALTMAGWMVALRTNDLFGSLLAAGITLMICVNAVINMAVVLGMLPTTGMVLPFVSYGGTGLLVYMSAVGILMNIARSDHEHLASRPARA